MRVTAGDTGWRLSAPGIDATGDTYRALALRLRECRAMRQEEIET
jgi:hypothetical protein